MLKNFEEIKEKVKSLETKKIAVVAAENQEVLEAVREATDDGVASAILTGDKNKIIEIAKAHNISLEGMKIIDTPDPLTSAKTCCKLILDKKAHCIMKGLVDTSVLMKAIVDKEHGLNAGKVISLVTTFELKTYHKLLIATDPGITIAPDLKQKVDLINSSVSLAHSIGIETPLVACCTAVEKVNTAMPATVDAALLAKMNDRGQIKECIVDGPLALDNAINAESAKIKKINSPVAGQADIILCNDIESANYLYKALIFLAGAKSGSVALGAKAPIILTSRADSHETKYNSILMALLHSSK